ncbi:ParA family protein [Gracilibacillus sp. YIM 98692]|uniref:ParA family protein n=1 Tax=Gracilibacillus sp. YIM 98692 TaxID=2663532 RepID=UPI0013CFED4D|nr:ParA family protein [Gracilibacillus sp. YIM 98692]
MTKIGIISNKSSYKEYFSQQDPSFEVEMLTSYKTTHTIDLLFVDGRVIHPSELEDIREYHTDIPIFYQFYDMKSDLLTQNIKRICIAQQIEAIHERLTVSQVVEKIHRYIMQESFGEEKRIISFFGTHSGSGVSTTIFSIAQAIGRQIEGKVLVLSLNAWDPADYFHIYEGEYLNDLKVELKMGQLTSDRLIESVTEVDNFFHLAGNRDIKLQRYYTDEEIQHLLQVAKETFDVVLVDGGTHFDTANAIQSYVNSNIRFIITNQDDKGYRGYFPHIFQQLIEPSGGKKSDFLLIINQYRPEMQLINEKDLEDELEIQRISTIPDLEPLGAIAIRQKKSLYHLADIGYRKEIERIAKVIIAEAQLRVKETVDTIGQEKKQGILGKLFNRKSQEETIW